MKNILNRGFSQLDVNALVTKVLFIITQLTGNPAFPATDPTLAQLSSALDALQQALVLADPQASEQAVKAARAILEQMLDDLADNLEKSVNMDPVKLATTGFDMRKEGATSSGAPSIPGNVRLRLTGKSGEAQVLFDPSDHARSYQVQTATDPNGPWTDYDTFSSTRNVVLSGFPRAKDIWVRVRGAGANNTKSGWSDPATILIN